MKTVVRNRRKGKCLLVLTQDSELYAGEKELRKLKQDLRVVTEER